MQSSTVTINNQKPILALIIPCYNEQEVLPETANRLLLKLQNLINDNIISPNSKIVFVDDGSGDNTWSIINDQFINNPQNFDGIKLSGNRGHQNALLCGLMSMIKFADVTISMDADLQDDINAIDQMMVKYNQGCEIVYAVRSSRKRDSFFKKTSAQMFYRFMHFLGVKIIYNHADFRLMGKNALLSLTQYGEVNLFLRGIVPQLGFKTDIVYYERKERFAGKSKYPLQKMLKFALEGITSFSISPIRLITLLGTVIFLISLIMIIYFITQHIRGDTAAGWASIICSIWGIGGLILLSLGVMGEYIGKIYLETKKRPRYIVEKILSEETLK
ncbi:MAG: glycosyltransferase family 2 protein [Treponema sp.]|nr:glycosyltransferase family 2 protein [Treponema sp.]